MLAGLGAEVDPALLTALALNQNRAVVEIDFLDIQPGEFTTSKAAAVEDSQ